MNAPKQQSSMTSLKILHYGLNIRKPRSSKSQRPRKVIFSATPQFDNSGVRQGGKTISQGKNSLGKIQPALPSSSPIMQNGEKVKIVNLQFSIPKSVLTNSKVVAADESVNKDQRSYKRACNIIGKQQEKAQTLLSTVSQNRRIQRKATTVARKKVPWNRKMRDIPKLSESSVVKETQGYLPKLNSSYQGREISTHSNNQPKQENIGIMPSEYLSKQLETLDKSNPFRKFVTEASQANMIYQVQKLPPKPAPTPFQQQMGQTGGLYNFGQTLRDQGKMPHSFPSPVPPCAIAGNTQQKFYSQQMSNYMSSLNPDQKAVSMFPPLTHSTESLDRYSVKQIESLEDISYLEQKHHLLLRRNQQSTLTQYKLSLQRHVKDSAVTTPKVISIGGHSKINTLESDESSHITTVAGRAGGGFGLGQNLIKEANLQMRTPQAAYSKHQHTMSAQHGANNVSNAEKRANDLMHQQMSSVINGGSQLSGAKIRARVSYFNPPVRTPSNNIMTNPSSGDMYPSPRRSNDSAQHSGNFIIRSSTINQKSSDKGSPSRLFSQYNRISPFSPSTELANSITDRSTDSNYVAACYNVVMGKEKQSKTYFIPKKTSEPLPQEIQRPSPSPNELFHPDLPPIDFYKYDDRTQSGWSTEQISQKPSVITTLRQQQQQAVVEKEGWRVNEEIKREEGDEEEEEQEEDEEERIEQMFIGQEFDDDNDRDSTSGRGSPSVKIRQLQDIEGYISEEEELNSLKSPDDIKIPVITHEDNDEPLRDKNQSPILKIKIPLPLEMKKEEEEDEKGDHDKPDTPTASSPPKTKVRKARPCLNIIAVTPLNLQHQYNKFVESGYKENPQFEYEYPALAAKFISQFKKPRTELLPVAENILNKFLKEYSSETEYLEKHCGRILTKEETEESFVKYIEDLSLQNHLSLVFSHNAVAPTSVVHDSRTGKSKICISMPIQYREKRMLGVMHHEIGTHFLRKYNDKFQIWAGKRKQYEMKPCIATEEGLASINQLCDHALAGDPKPYLYKGAINYYACCKAAEMSFVELFQEMGKYIDDPFRRWKHCLRVKRGMTDTSQPGGMYKDQVYLEGSIKILRNRKQIDFVALHCGRMTVDDSLRPFIKKKVKKDPCKQNVLLKDMKKYLKAVEIIAKVNQVDTIFESPEQ